MLPFWWYSKYTFCVFTNTFTLLHLLLWRWSTLSSVFPPFTVILCTKLFSVTWQYSENHILNSCLMWSDHHYSLFSVSFWLSRVFILVATLGDVSQIRNYSRKTMHGSLTDAAFHWNSLPSLPKEKHTLTTITSFFTWSLTWWKILLQSRSKKYACSPYRFYLYQLQRLQTYFAWRLCYIILKLHLFATPNRAFI